MLIAYSRAISDYAHTIGGLQVYSRRWVDSKNAPIPTPDPSSAVPPAEGGWSDP